MAALGVASGLGCAPPSDAESSEDGSLRGELAVYIADRPDGSSEKRYFLRQADGTELRLLFDPAPVELEPGNRLAVQGVPEADALRVTSFQPVASGPPVATPALVTATPFSPRSFAFVFVDIGGGITGTNTPAVADAFMTSNADSIRRYYLADSYGRQDISTYVTQTALSYPMADCNSSTTNALANALRPKVGNYQHYLWYFGSTNPACNWSGLASLGTPSNPSRDTWYNHATSCVVLVQEPGHNFGMQHSSALTCPGGPLADDPNGCTDSEYGDPFDPMGAGCRHMNAWQKAYQGWFGGCNGVKISDSGTFNLLPFEDACSGAQFLQIKAPKTRTYNRPAGGGGSAGKETFTHYYLELRTPRDFDGTLVAGSKGLEPMVLVHVADELRTRTQAGLHTFLLDMTPGTSGHAGFSDAGLSTGQSFTDPAGGLTITAQSVTADGATVVVKYAAGSGSGPVCLDGRPFSNPAPDSSRARRVKLRVPAEAPVTSDRRARSVGAPSAVRARSSPGCRARRPTPPAAVRTPRHPSVRLLRGGPFSCS